MQTECAGRGGDEGVAEEKRLDGEDRVSFVAPAKIHC